MSSIHENDEIDCCTQEPSFNPKLLIRHLNGTDISDLWCVEMIAQFCFLGSDGEPELFFGIDSPDRGLIRRGHQRGVTGHLDDAQGNYSDVSPSSQVARHL